MLKNVTENIYEMSVLFNIPMSIEEPQKLQVFYKKDICGFNYDMVFSEILEVAKNKLSKLITENDISFHGYDGEYITFMVSPLFVRNYIDYYVKTLPIP